MMLDLSKPQILVSDLDDTNLLPIIAYSDISNATCRRNVTGLCILYQLIIHEQYG